MKPFICWITSGSAAVREQGCNYAELFNFYYRKLCGVLSHSTASVLSERAAMGPKKEESGIKAPHSSPCGSSDDSLQFINTTHDNKALYETRKSHDKNKELSRWKLIIHFGLDSPR